MLDDDDGRGAVVVVPVTVVEPRLPVAVAAVIAA
jgi:hypothetical protein